MLRNIHESLKVLLLIFSAIVPISSNDGQVFENWAATEIKIVHVKQAWTIENFSLCDQKVGEKLMSPTFTSGNNDTACKWRMEIYPKGVKAHKDYVALFIFAVSCNASVQFKLSILNAKHDEINVLNNTQNCTVGLSWGYDVFVKQDFVFNEENEILLHDKLTVVCELNVTVGNESTSEELMPTKPQLQFKQNYLVKDLSFLLVNQTFTDVVLSAGGQEFRVLKVILAIRSPVFKAMFENDNQGSNISRIEITDTDPQVLREMLRYIYTEESPNLLHLACDLLAAAEKYEIIGLKLMCEDSLSENLTVENAADYFILGETYSAEKLKNQARSFIVSHAPKIAKSHGLASMIQTHPRLAEEIFLALSGSSTSCIEIE